MEVVYGDFWTYPADHRVITTNGAVRNDGACVMGRGVALQAARRYPSLPFDLGLCIGQFGNVVHRIGQYGNDSIWSFPVKHHWRQEADLDLIERSAEALTTEAERHPEQTWVLVRPGVGNGRRDWVEVEPRLSTLPDNVRVITWETP